MLSGREEPEQTDLQMVPLRPQSLRDYPALGAAGSKDADWSEIASGSDPEAENTLGALPSSAPVQHKFVKRHSLVDIWTCDFLVRMVKAAFPQFEFMWLAEEMKKNLPLELCFTQVIPSFYLRHKPPTAVPQSD